MKVSRQIFRQMYTLVSRQVSMQVSRQVYRQFDMQMAKQAEEELKITLCQPLSNLQAILNQHSKTVCLRLVSSHVPVCIEYDA